MGWRGTVRSIGAAVRAAERDNLRRARENAKQLVAAQKSAVREQAAEAVRLYGEFIESLVAAHRSSAAPIDWTARANERPPSEPKRPNRREAAARDRLEAFRPSLLMRLFGTADKHLRKRRADLEKGIADDAEAYANALAEHQKRLAAHEDDSDLAKKILAGDTEAMLEFLNALNPFGNIATIGESLRISIPNRSTVAITLDVHGQDVIPKEVPKLLKSGMLSMKSMPQGEYQRLYQDHVCSGVLRVGAETFAALPVDLVIVTAVDDLVDQATGHLVSTPILSVALRRETMKRLNLAAIDPSDAMKNFKHEMRFRATVGFSAIQPLDPASLTDA